MKAASPDLVSTVVTRRFFYVRPVAAERVPATRKCAHAAHAAERLQG